LLPHPSPAADAFAAKLRPVVRNLLGRVERHVLLDVTPVTPHVTAVIKTFKDQRTAAVFLGRMLKGFPSDIFAVAQRKLTTLHIYARLADLRAPPSNRLEALKGDRAGQHSIRVNDQWRICFAWRDGHAYDVEIIDYH